jgi:hypothetical protein
MNQKTFIAWILSFEVVVSVVQRCGGLAKAHRIGSLSTHAPRQNHFIDLWFSPILLMHL